MVSYVPQFELKTLSQAAQNRSKSKLAVKLYHDNDLPIAEICEMLGI